MIADELGVDLVRPQFQQDAQGYPLCQGHFPEGNLVVDRQTFEVKEVLHWEHRGYYLPEIDPRRYQIGHKMVVLPDHSTSAIMLR